MVLSLKDISNEEMLIAPSILSADFADLKTEIERTKKAEIKVLHIDVMDGHFVPNISIGIPVVRSLRKVTNQIFDVHLMISEPEKYIESFVKAGADHITFHIESENDPEKVINEIRKYSISTGISIKPKTNPEILLPFIEKIDMILVMSVEPGFGGQIFMDDMMKKLEYLKKHISKIKRNIHIEVDGGINSTTAPIAKKSGANVFVAGNALFKHPKGVINAISELKKAISV